MRFPGEPAMPPLAHSFKTLGFVLAEMASSIGDTVRCPFSGPAGLISGVLMGGDDASEAGGLLLEVVLLGLLVLAVIPQRVSQAV
jgi:hypothetical protein